MVIKLNCITGIQKINAHTFYNQNNSVGAVPYEVVPANLRRLTGLP